MRGGAGCPRTRAFTQAHRAFRLLANGLPVPARARPGADRAARPRRCTLRGGHDVAMVLRAPADSTEGVAWCARCAPASAAT
eukprot:3822468-Alexandrium_andersonii.AAC.1